MNSTISARQRAVFFSPADDSGATIGHQCTIVDIDPVSRVNFPHEPNAWRVLVYFRHLKEFREVDARDLIATDERDDAELPPLAPPHLELQFTADLRDRDRIEGKFRKGRWYWQQFVFAKADQPCPSYELRGNVAGSQMELCELVYFVPRSECLNRVYVVQAMREIFALEWK